MKNITTKGPKFLIGLEFNIPLFNAKGQMYKCINVDEIKNDSIEKMYSLEFDEIAVAYSVPKTIKLELLIPNNTTRIGATLYDTENGKRWKLSDRTFDVKDIQTIAGIKEILIELANKHY